jgi:hypothetical protein
VSKTSYITEGACTLQMIDTHGDRICRQWCRRNQDYNEWRAGDHHQQRKSSDVVLCSTGPTVGTIEYGCHFPSGWGIGLEHVRYGEYKWRAAMSTLKPMMRCCGMCYVVATCSTSGLDGPGQDQSSVNGQPDISTALYLFHFYDNLSPPTVLRHRYQPTRQRRHSHMYRLIPRCRHRPVPRLVGAMSS